MPFLITQVFFNYETFLISNLGLTLEQESSISRNIRKIRIFFIFQAWT